MELGQYLDKISDESSSNEDLTNNTNNAGQNNATELNQLEEEDILTSFGETEPTNWLTIHQQKLQRPYRELNMESVKEDDYECPLCMRTLWKPITTPCGHTFCKTCLDRVLDHNTNCPMCKSAALKSYLSERRETMSNEFVETQLKLHLPTEYAERMKIHENEMQVKILALNFFSTNFSQRERLKKQTNFLFFEINLAVAVEKEILTNIR